MGNLFKKESESKLFIRKIKQANTLYEFDNIDYDKPIDGIYPIFYICKYCQPFIVKYVLESQKINLETENQDNKMRIIHYVSKYCKFSIIKYVIDKGVNLEATDSDGWRPIHYICEFSTPEMIKYIIDKGVNLEVETDEKWRPIHFICRYSTPEMIKYIIDKEVNLEA